MGCARQVLLVLILACGMLLPLDLHSQDPRGPPQQNDARGFRLEQNYPNPVNPETWIPFILEEDLFADADSGIVSIRIFNVLRQLVAIPIAVEHERGRDARVDHLAYRTPGRKVAYWDGRDINGRRVPSGVYYYRMEVNDLPPQVNKLIVANPRRRGTFIPWFGRN